MKPVCHWTASSFNGWDMLLNLNKLVLGEWTCQYIESSVYLECTWFKQYHSQSLAGIWTCYWFQGENWHNKLVDWTEDPCNPTLRTESLSAGGPVSQPAEKHLAKPPSPITSFTWRGHILYIINLSFREEDEGLSLSQSLVGGPTKTPRTKSSLTSTVITDLEDIFCNSQLAARFDVRHPLINKADVAGVGCWMWVHLRMSIYIYTFHGGVQWHVYLGQNLHILAGSDQVWIKICLKKVSTV